MDQQELRNLEILEFPSPLGEVVLESQVSQETAIAELEFPSPLGEVVLESPLQWTHWQ